MSSTPVQTETMTDLQVSAVIETHLGRTLRTQTRTGKPDPDGVVLARRVCEGGGWHSWVPVPNYCEDQNAMHAAEKSLTRSQCFAYRFALLGAAMLAKDTDPPSMHFAFGPPARARAHAFIKTIGQTA